MRKTFSRTFGDFGPSAILLIFNLFLVVQSWAQPCREVVGYYAGWQWYDRNKLMSPQTVPYDKYTILTYAFFQPQPDGTIKISDPWGDKNQLLGPINWATAPAGYDTQYDFGNPAYHQPNQKLSDYAHQGGCKLIVSVGGWTYSTNFPAIAASATKRATFAHDCNTMVKLYGLDGIDIDWEYPGTNTDKQNYTILLQQLRDSLDAIEPVVNRQLSLSIAAGAAPSHISFVEWNNVVNILDMINLMSYDFYGTWDNTTNHNAPLYPSASGAQTGFSCSEAVTNLLAQGVPANKINMGVAWYGRSHITVGSPNVYVAGTGQADMGHFSADDGTPLYYNIMLAMNQFDYHWDNAAQVPYLTGKTTNSFVSYDDEMSIEKKAAYINSKNLRGAIIWEISGDYIESTTAPGTIAATPLIDKLNTTFCSGNTGIDAANTLKVSVYPNPAQKQLGIFLKETINENISFQLTDLNGKMVILDNFEGKDYHLLNISHLSSGIYFLHIKSGEKGFTGKVVKE